MPFNNIISRTDAQALIPENVSNVMLTNLEAQSAALGLFTQIPLATNQTRFPVLSALPTAYFVSGDTGLKQTSEANWANKYINVEEIAVIVPIPESVADDVTFNIFDSVRPLMEQAIARTLDAAIFFGANKPASWPTDIAASAVAAGNVIARGTNPAAEGGIAEDINELLGTVEADGFNPNGFVAEGRFRSRLRGARDTTGQSLNETAGGVERVWNLPVQYAMPGLWPTGVNAAELFAGDWGQQIVGIRKDMTYKLLTEGVITDNTNAIVYNLPQQDMFALRLVFRVGWATANPINYTQSVEASRYPVAVLRSPAV